MISTGQVPELLFALTVNLALAVVALVALYWVIRLAVRHAIADADRRRANQQR